VDFGGHHGGDPAPKIFLPANSVEILMYCTYKIFMYKTYVRDMYLCIQPTYEIFMYKQPTYGYNCNCYNFLGNGCNDY
jgi:hypothetical protein